MFLALENMVRLQVVSHVLQLGMRLSSALQGIPNHFSRRQVKIIKMLEREVVAAPVQAVA